MPPELLGPLGLTVALGFAVVALWRDHLRADADDRAERDRAAALLAAQTPAIDRLADGQKDLIAAVRDLIRERVK